MTRRKLLISGSRSFADRPEAKKKIIEGLYIIVEHLFKFDPFAGDKLIVGNARGVDIMAINYIMSLGSRYTHIVPYTLFRSYKPNWDKYGKAAGPINNKKMVDMCTKGAVIWDGVSKGTKNCLEELIKADKLLLKIVIDDKNEVFINE